MRKGVLPAHFYGASAAYGNSLRNYYRVFHLILTALLHYHAQFKNVKQRLNFYSYHGVVVVFIM